MGLLSYLKKTFVGLAHVALSLIIFVIGLSLGITLMIFGQPLIGFIVIVIAFFVARYYARQSDKHFRSGDRDSWS